MPAWHTTIEPAQLFHAIDYPKVCFLDFEILTIVKGQTRHLGYQRRWVRQGVALAVLSLPVRPLPNPMNHRLKFTRRAKVNNETDLAKEGIICL